MPCIAVETHNYALDTSAILRASAFREQFINLFLSGVETQVTNLVLEKKVMDRFRDGANKTHIECRRLCKQVDLLQSVNARLGVLII
jgi:hypothetical protein